MYGEQEGEEGKELKRGSGKGKINYTEKMERAQALQHICAWVKRGRVSGSFKKLQRSADSNGNE